MDFDPKLIKALLDNYRGERAPVSTGNPTVDAFLEGTRMRWIPAPEGMTCPRCGGALERSYSLMGGPWAGAVRCTTCTYRESVMAHIAKAAFTVQPMPLPSKTVFYYSGEDGPPSDGEE